jgi:hypothetical protein
LACWLIDHAGCAVSESTVYRVLKRHGLIREVKVVGFPAGPEYRVRMFRGFGPDTAANARECGGDDHGSQDIPEIGGGGHGAGARGGTARGGADPPMSARAKRPNRCATSSTKSAIS